MDDFILNYWNKIDQFSHKIALITTVPSVDKQWQGHIFSGKSRYFKAHVMVVYITILAA